MLHDKKSVDGTARVLKNSAAIFAASLLAKGGGLIVTILVARYLGASSLGIYAVVLAVALLVEVMTPLGHQEVIVREIARDRSKMFVHWVNASASTIVASILFGAGLVVYLQLTAPRVDAAVAVYIAAAGLPVAGLNLVAQSVLQGVERMQYQTVAAFVGRAVSLVLLWLLLQFGAGIWSAFLSRAVFQLISFLILGWAILRHADANEVQRVWRPSLSGCRSGLSAARPFAMQRLLNEGLLRLNIIILPLLVSLDAVGQFNAANQITQTASTIIPIMMLTLLPVFARNFRADPEKSAMMANKLLKFLLVLIFPFALVIAVAAGKIIPLLYGSGYEASVPILQLIIWSQVFFAADSVMKQKMIASDNERAMVWRSLLGLLTNVALTIVLGKAFGLFGIAAAVVLANIFLLTLDAVFVERHVARINIAQSSIKPFICALLAGVVAFALSDYGLLVLLPGTAVAYLIFLMLFGTFTADERLLIKALVRRVLARSSG